MVDTNAKLGSDRVRQRIQLPAFVGLGSGSTTSRGDLARRIFLLLVIVALHLLLILWLASSPLPERVAPPAIMNVFSVPLSSGRSASAHQVPTKMPTPAKVLLPATPITPGRSVAGASPPSVDAGTTPGTEAVGGCSLAQDVGQAIEHDPAAMAELDALPPTLRTSADVVMLWNGQWLDSGETAAGTDTGSLRRVVEQVVAGASVECRDATVAGPRFIPVPEGTRTATIVVGSGSWRWGDLLASSADCSPVPSTACPAIGGRPTATN